MSWAAVAVGVGTLAYGIYSSEHDKAQAKKAEQAAGSKPLYQIPEPTLKNQTIVENRAQQGLADSTKQIYMENADRGLSASLDTLTKLGGGVNSIGDIYNNYEESQRTLALMEDQAKFANQQLLINQNNLMANENDKTWQLNILYPWMDKQKGIAEKKARANATLQSSVGTAAQLFGKAAAANYGNNGNGGSGNRGNGNGGSNQIITTGSQGDQNAMLDYQQYYDPKYEYRGDTGYNTENYVMEQLGQDQNTSSGSGMYPEDDFLLKIFGQG